MEELKKLYKTVEEMDVENVDEDKSYAYQKKGTAGQVGYQWALQDIMNKIQGLIDKSNTP